VFGRCEAVNGIAPFDNLVEQVMTRPPYNDVRRVFWIVDNCSVHRGQRAVERLRQRYPRRPIVQLRACSHSRQLAQSGRELLFDRQRKLLTPNDFPNLDALAERLLEFQHYWESTAQPFDWKFTREDLKCLLSKLDKHGASYRHCAAAAGLCRGITWWAHRDDDRSAAASFPRSSKIHIGSVDPYALKYPPEGGGTLANGGTLRLHFTLNRNTPPETRAVELSTSFHKCAEVFWV
jgi:hypothetical protein